MTNSKINIQIASENWKDSARLVAEVSYEGQEWAYVYKEGGQFFVDLYPRNDGRQWTIAYEDLFDALELAKAKLNG